MTEIEQEALLKSIAEKNVKDGDMDTDAAWKVLAKINSTDGFSSGQLRTQANIVFALELRELRKLMAKWVEAK